MLPLAAVNQLYKEKTATVQFHANDFKLSKHQATQTIDAACSNLKYDIKVPPRPDPYEATIYADGPCGDIGVSKLAVYIHVIPCACAPGFEIDSDNDSCKCKCDEQLLDYIILKQIQL